MYIALLFLNVTYFALLLSVKLNPAKMF
jgi:hypothetical protein